MRLLSLEVCDFRAFHGVQKVRFAADDERRVTVFHGENGAGKTNLLNAVFWCMTGQFTPRFKEPNMLVNREAARAGRRECYVELIFRDDLAEGGREYSARRTYRGDGRSSLEVHQVDRGNYRPMANGQMLLDSILPPALSSWFFFDAEAIGSLELSGSAAFKRDLRKTLGFALVDMLLEDLEAVLSKRRREAAAQTNDKQLQSLQERIDDIDRVLPGQQAAALQLEKDQKRIEGEYEDVRSQLAKLPQAEPIERERRNIERRMKQLDDERSSVSAKIAHLIGLAAPSLLIKATALPFEEKLEQDEVRSKLPAPYSDQLVKDIEAEGVCICGRPIVPGSEEAHKVHSLLQHASTSALNQRIQSVRYLIRDIERNASAFPLEITALRARLTGIDHELGTLEQTFKDLTAQLQGINIGEVTRLEFSREKLKRERNEVVLQAGRILEQIDQNLRRQRELKAQFETAQRKVAVGAKLQAELSKVKKLIDHIRSTLASQEKTALVILGQELNDVLRRYLTKHYKARINPANYAVQLVDEHGSTVGDSTGEGQVLKFAFIATVTALAARKTQQKIQWMAEPAVAPLVLDAPFSALDPVYQGSVARNLAAQTTQLVLMLSSAAWGQQVSKALADTVGKRYLIVSHESGSQGEKPIKSIDLGGKSYPLNYYGAERTESTIVEIE